MDDLVIGIFNSRENASDAIDDLRAAGYTNEQISVITRDTAELQEWREGTNVNDVADDTAKGAVAGGVIGGLAGLLLGVGAITLPPIGGVVIAGPLAAALGISTTGASTLAGAGIGAAGGGIVGALSNLGISNEDAELYQRMIIDEGILIAVEKLNKENMEGLDVEEIFSQNGAVEVNEIGDEVEEENI